PRRRRGCRLGPTQRLGPGLGGGPGYRFDRGSRRPGPRLAGGRDTPGLVALPVGASATVKSLTSMTSRVVIEHVRPAVECGLFAAKATLGLPLEISADVFSDGHDELRAWATLAPAETATVAGEARGRRRAGSKEPDPRGEIELEPAGNDRW